MDEAMEPQSVLPEGAEGLMEPESFYQIKAIEAQTRELAHIGDALGMISNHLAILARREED